MKKLNNAYTRKQEKIQSLEKYKHSSDWKNDNLFSIFS